MGVGKRYDSMGLNGRVDSGQLAVVSEEKSGGRESERAQPFPAVVGSSSSGPFAKNTLGKVAGDYHKPTYHKSLILSIANLLVLEIEGF